MILKNLKKNRRIYDIYFSRFVLSSSIFNRYGLTLNSKIVRELNLYSKAVAILSTVDQVSLSGAV